jgi:Haem-binding domain
MEVIMKIVKVLGILVLIGLVVFALIQLIPYGRSHKNPSVVQEPAWDAQTRAIAKKACFDCHSNETVWPWYSNIAPVSWLVQRDVDEGRSKLNFSDWGHNVRSVAEIIDEIQGGDMPPGQYKLMHPAAKLTATEKQTFIQGLQGLSK